MVFKTEKEFKKELEKCLQIYDDFNYMLNAFENGEMLFIEFYNYIAKQAQINCELDFYIQNEYNRYFIVHPLYTLKTICENYINSDVDYNITRHHFKIFYNWYTEIFNTELF